MHKVSHPAHGSLVAHHVDSDQARTAAIVRSLETVTRTMGYFSDVESARSKADGP
jgi:hypothetical protein